MELSRATFGFYPSYFPYTLNYPWVAAHLEGLHKKSHVLDIGAGVSPLPLYLANRGIGIECVDNSAHIRQLPPTPDWNEWGYFDYGSLNPNVTAHHCDIASFEPRGTFDAIYSVAALAHMTRARRDDVLRRCYAWLQPQGMLLLTIDVIPSTDFVWNRCEGAEVEAPVQHGTIEDVLDELQRLGFQIDESNVMRTVYKSRTDLLFIKSIR